MEVRSEFCKLSLESNLDALPKIAEGSANKIFLPLEATGILGAIGGIGELFNGKAPTVPYTFP